MSRDDDLWKREVSGYLEYLESEGQELGEQGLMTRREVARFLSVSVRTVQRMEARGTLTRVTLPGVGLAFYPRREVEQLIKPAKKPKFEFIKSGRWG